MKYLLSIRPLVLLSIIVLIASPAISAGQGDKSQPMPFNQLKKAVSFDQGVMGERIAPTEEYLAYKEALKIAAANRALIVSLLKEATPAGKIYLAILLRYIDEDAGSKALADMAADQTKINVILGCMSMDDSASTISQDLLRKWTESMYYPEK